MAAAYNRFVDLSDLTGGDNRTNYVPELNVCCSNGVGALAIKQFLPKQLKDLSLNIINDGTGAASGGAVLNDGCGADFVKTKIKPVANSVLDGRYATFDGDADRLIYYIWKRGKFSLLDGDRIATLFAKFLGDKMRACGLTGLNVGLVQTGYANGGTVCVFVFQLEKKMVRQVVIKSLSTFVNNRIGNLPSTMNPPRRTRPQTCLLKSEIYYSPLPGASTAYGSSVLGRPPVRAKTGVKHCHAKAVKMDVGIYFEANGHGTVVFSDKFRKAVAQCARSPDKSVAHSGKLLIAFRDLVNEAVGDAISDMLCVEAVLRHLKWSEEDWLAE